MANLKTGAERDLFDICAEVKSISMIVSGLSNNLDSEGDCLSTDALKTAFFGVTEHLERIAEELGEMELEHTEN